MDGHAGADRDPFAAAAEDPEFGNESGPVAAFATTASAYRYICQAYASGSPEHTANVLQDYGKRVWGTFRSAAEVIITTFPDRAVQRRAIAQLIINEDTDFVGLFRRLTGSPALFATVAELVRQPTIGGVEEVLEEICTDEEKSLLDAATSAFRELFETNERYFILGIEQREAGGEEADDPYRVAHSWTPERVQATVRIGERIVWAIANIADTRSRAQLPILKILPIDGSTLDPPAMA
ncbi:MAG TPA: hypothetical protein VLE99_01075 [Candidatus Saccharimonadales bacterium]|nr:hypothetical protein [Candidatus Saccharimonadales bacterium]